MIAIRALLLLLLLPLVALAAPPTPTNTPRAHPLAPNPHTSIGLIWVYTDPNTGRQWTASGGTYKIKRCSGASCTPTTVVASGLANVVSGLARVDYQDFGLSSNTIYGYRIVANDGADSGDSPTVYMTTLAADSNLVQWPDARWEKILGPQVEAAQIPFTWFNSTATTNGQTIISKFPIVGPGNLLGTGATTSGSNILTGTNTKFLEQVAANNPTCLDAISLGGTNLGAIASVDSNTQITLVTNAPSTQSGAALTTNISGLCGFNDPLGDYLIGNQLMYYDSPFALWKVYGRTGDPQYLRGAIQGSESIFAGYLWLGRNRAWNSFSTTASGDNMPAPRNFQFTGYLMFGLAGHNGVWDPLADYLAKVDPTWLSNYRGGNNDFTYQREKAYMVLYRSQFVIAAPDSFPRSDGTTTSLNGTITVDGDLTDGLKDYWRDQLDIDLPGFITDDQTADGLWYDTSGGADNAENDYPYPPGIGTQPFIGGLMGEALGSCWNNTDLSTTARNAARKLTLKHATALALRAYNTNIVADEPSVRWNTIWYFIGGGPRLNTNAFMYGADSSILNDTPDINMIQQYRQATPLMMKLYGLAWEMSGHQWFKDIGDELANDALAEVGENTIGTGSDGKKSLCDADNNFKDYGQCYRASPDYFAHRLATPALLGTAPVVTMPSNQTLTGGVNQVELPASVTCTNTPCTYKWHMVEYPLVLGRQVPQAIFSSDDALTTKLSGLEPGAYKVGFYALDALGLPGRGTVNVTVGDGVFPPVVVIQKEGGQAWCQSGSSLANIEVRAYSAAGRTLTHTLTGTGPKDQSAPTVSPTTSTSNSFNVTVSGMSAGWWILKDVVTDSAGASRTAYFVIAITAGSCSGMSQPSNAHNTLPIISAPPNHVLPPGSTSTRLYVAPNDPEGFSGFLSAATGYTLGYNSSAFLVTAFTHSWSQTGGPVSATITNGSTLTPTITGMTTAGTYTFRYTGTDQQSDSVTKDITVTTSSLSAVGGAVLGNKVTLSGKVTMQ